jgi:predicted GIY-YIG superfamily endonuclease
MFFVYTLRSERTGHLYTGYTENVTQRLGQHSEGLTKSTKTAVRSEHSFHGISTPFL